jgi:L-lactate dehydrogenase complex protein LldE
MRMKASLFITCLVDQLFPQVGLKTVELLRRLSVEVRVNPAQTCCGQPAFNTGHRREARRVAAGTLELLEAELEGADYVVVPSGSCAAMIRNSYAELFADDPVMRGRAEALGARVLELSEFLIEVLGVEDVGASFEGAVTYHDSCHLLRELGVSGAPRKLIGAVRGAEFVELAQADACCGFGGMFSVEYPEISAAILEEKVRQVERSGAGALLACDAGCLMQMRGALSRRGSQVRCMHLAEFLQEREAQTT